MRNEPTFQAADTLADVRRYYGEVLRATSDLKTSACCAGDVVPPHLREIVAAVHPEVRERFYGCGLPLPPALAGCTVVDLGCGTGRDTFVLSRLVGEHGRVIGVDMTEEQLAVAHRHRDWHAERYGYARSNVGSPNYIEDLAALGLADASVDIVVSNCVVNLSPDKPRVFRESSAMLKPGGELFSRTSSPIDACPSNCNATRCCSANASRERSTTRTSAASSPRRAAPTPAS
jgi:SAM-dependent methyltransferase